MVAAWFKKLIEILAATDYAKWEGVLIRASSLVLVVILLAKLLGSEILKLIKGGF